MYRHVTLFLKSMNASLPIFSLRDRTINFTKYASRIPEQVYNKAKKLPVYWPSKVPFKYKRNAITGELHRARRIASDFGEETKRIRSKYTDARYPKHVIENTIRNFNRKKDELLIPPWLFETYYNIFAFSLEE